MTFFKFNERFYKQNYGLPMGNPLSEILASLFLEFLQSGPFKYGLPSDTTYFRYIDNILIFLLQKIKIEEIAEKLNNVELSIHFIYIYIYIIAVLVVTKSLCGFVLNQVQYNMESAQYLG